MIDCTAVAGAFHHGVEGLRLLAFPIRSGHAAAFACSLNSQNYDPICNRAPRASWATYSRWPPMLLPLLSAYHQSLPLKFGFTSTTYLNLTGSSQLKVTL